MAWDMNGLDSVQNQKSMVSLAHSDDNNETTDAENDIDRTIVESALSLVPEPAVKKELGEYMVEIVKLSFLEQLSLAINKFTFDLYKLILCNQKKNIIFSPMSFMSLLNMCYLCSSDKQKYDCERLLHYKGRGDDDLILSPTILKKTMLFLFKTLKRVSKHEESQYPENLILDNSVYTRDGFLTNQHGKTLKSIFDADIVYNNFNDSTALDAIKNTVNSKTRSLTHKNLHDILMDIEFDSKIYMLLFNNLHFECEWKLEFSKIDTGFFKLGDRDIEVSIMSTKDKFNYARKPSGLPISVCEIPFKNDTFLFTVILPDVTENIEEIENNLTYDVFHGLLENLVHKKIEVTIPVFHIYNHCSLNEIFEKLQANSLNDFKDVDCGLGIHNAFYKSYIGTKQGSCEASNSTGFILKHENTVDEQNGNTCKIDKNERQDEDIDSFVCDRPFLFFIRESETNTILYFGKLAEPE